MNATWNVNTTVGYTMDILKDIWNIRYNVWITANLESRHTIANVAKQRLQYD
jgi:hypothetical protein